MLQAHIPESCYAALHICTFMYTKIILHILIHFHIRFNRCSHVHATGAHSREVLCRFSYMNMYIYTDHTAYTIIFTTHTIIFSCTSKFLLTRTRCRRTWGRGAMLLPGYKHASYFTYLYLNMNIKLCTHTHAASKYAFKSMHTHTRHRRTRKRGAIQTKECKHHTAHTWIDMYVQMYVFKYCIYTYIILHWPYKPFFAYMYTSYCTCPYFRMNINPCTHTHMHTHTRYRL